jgi:hypothetical protein
VTVIICLMESSKNSFIFRYYFGVIDIFTEYGLRQKLSRWLKTIIYCSADHSSAPPEVYAERFFDFVEAHLESQTRNSVENHLQSEDRNLVETHLELENP